jgi:tRNA(Ile)-lysidine synthase
MEGVAGPGGGRGVGGRGGGDRGGGGRGVGGRGGAVEVRERVLATGLLAAERPLVVMLSGGCDSVCLLDLVVDLCGAGLVRVLHVNYGLRAEASEGDQQHCEQLCERLGVALEVIRPERLERAPGNVQAWARDVRYEAALRLAERDDALVAVGHTATDQIETILYRLAASPGRRALLGMPAAEGRVIRPLLGITREQTAAYCAERGVTWREDATNETDAYARGRVRHGLLTALRAVHPGADGNILRTAQLLREETGLLEQLVDLELDGESSIAIERLGELHPALARLVVVRLAEQAAGPGTYVPQAGDRVAEILELAARQGRAELHIGGLVSAVIEGRRLRMVKIAPHYPSPGRDAGHD